MPSPVFSRFRDYFEGDNLKLFHESQSDLIGLATSFVSRQYFEEIEELPRMQDIPEEAFLELTSANPKPPATVFVSHNWTDLFTPGDDVIQRVRRLIPAGARVGVWLDYCCLPQARRNGVDDRSDSEKAFFEAQLQYLPTIILKTQMMALWDARSSNRAWCVTELIVADIFRQLIMKQTHHNMERLEDPITFAVQTYDTNEFITNRPFKDRIETKILLHSSAKSTADDFYNFLLAHKGLQPTYVSTLLGRTNREDIAAYFASRRLECSRPSDVDLLITLLHRICAFAGSYDVSTIKWSGKIAWSAFAPYMFANLSDFSVGLIDYDF